MKQYFSFLAICALYTASIFAGSIDSDQLRATIQRKINDLEKGHQILNRAIKQRTVITPTDIKTYKDMLHKAAHNMQELNHLSQEIRDYVQESAIALFYILNAMLENDMKNIQLLKNNALKKVYTKSVDNFRATVEDLKQFFNENRDSVVKFYEKVEKTVGDFKELFNKIVKDLKAQRTEPINLSLKSISESALRGKPTHQVVIVSPSQEKVPVTQINEDVKRAETLYQKLINIAAQAQEELNRVPAAHPHYAKLKTKVNGYDNQIKTQLARLKNSNQKAFFDLALLMYNDLNELIAQLKQASKEEMHILPVIEEESGEFTTQDPHATIAAIADMLGKIQKAQELARQKITGVDFNLISEKQLANYQAQSDALKQEMATAQNMSMVDEKINMLGQSITESIDRGTDHINSLVKSLINQIKFNFAQVDAPDKKKFNILQHKADYYLTHVVRKKEDDPVAFYQLAILSYNDIKQALE